MVTNKHELFFKLLQAGLWSPADTGLRIDGTTDWVDRIAEEQSVMGLVLAGIECFKIQGLSLNIPQDLLLQWIGEVQFIEQQNKAMNEFLSRLLNILREEDVHAVLVKGQGIAQCYERPLWRVPGDVDFLLSDMNYEKAKNVLLPLAIETEQEYQSIKHIGMTMEDGFVVELHGTLHSRLSKRIDRGIDEAQNDVLSDGNVRNWLNTNTQVFLPGINNDVIFVFTHILHHFYREGIGLRQICDWCRLLWTYKESLNRELLESRIQKMGLMSEWRAFAVLAVDWLGMPLEAMPMYSNEKKWSRKAERIMEFVLEMGNFGQNRERGTSKYYLGRKLASMFRKLKDFGHHAKIFPVDSVKFFCHFAVDGVGGALRGE